MNLAKPIRNPKLISVILPAACALGGGLALAAKPVGVVDSKRMSSRNTAQELVALHGGK